MSTFVVDKEVWLVATYQAIAWFQNNFVAKSEESSVCGNQCDIMPGSGKYMAI
jgi:hypothetical protein